MPTKKELGRALEQAREKYRFRNRTKFAAQMNVNESVIRDREKGRTAITISDVVDYANVIGVTPIELFADLMSYCDRNRWKQIAERLGCSVPMAKRKIKEACRVNNLSQEQVWSKYLQEQIRL